MEPTPIQSIALSDPYDQGYEAGWADRGATVERLVEKARQEGFDAGLASAVRALGWHPPEAA